MNIKEIRSILKESLGEDLEIQIDDIKPDDDLFSFGLDSINVIRLVIGIENKLGIEFCDEDLERENWKSLNLIERMISTKKTNY